MKNLQSIGLSKGTDKATHHDYCRFYEAYLPRTLKKLVEIGVFEGASLKMWSEYYPSASIYGIDIFDKKNFDTKKIKTLIADQSKREELNRAINSIGAGIDVVIDDGGHTMEQQQVSMATFLPHTKYYILEDLHTSLVKAYLLSGCNFGVTDESATVLRGLIQYMYGGDYKKCFPFLTEEEVNRMEKYIDKIYLLHADGDDKEIVSITAIIKTKNV